MNDDSLNDVIIDHITAMSERDFQAFGADGLAYIRPTDSVGKSDSFSVYAADGSLIASGSDIPTLRAIAMLLQ